MGFIRCGLEVTDDLQYVHSGCKQIGYQHIPIQVALLFAECSSVALREVTVMESYGYGLLGYNTMMFKLDHCLFNHSY